MCVTCTLHGLGPARDWPMQGTCAAHGCIHVYTYIIIHHLILSDSLLYYSILSCIIIYYLIYWLKVGGASLPSTYNITAGRGPEALDGDQSHQKLFRLKLKPNNKNKHT